MSVVPLTNHRFHVPTLGEPAKIQGMTIIVVVRCQQCDAGEDLALVNAQPAACPTCGAIVSLDRVTWDKDVPVPSIALSATPSRARSLQ